MLLCLLIVQSSLQRVRCRRWCKTFLSSPTMPTCIHGKRFKNVQRAYKSLLKLPAIHLRFPFHWKYFLMLLIKWRNHLFIQCDCTSRNEIFLHLSASSSTRKFMKFSFRLIHCSCSNRERLSRMMHWNSFKWKVNGQSNFCT